MIKTLLPAVGLLVAMSSLTFAQSATPVAEADCTAWLGKVDANADGSLTDAESKPFLDKLATANTQPATAGTLTKDEFMKECQAGAFTGIPNQ